MGMERVKHTEIAAYAEIHELNKEERWHLYRVVVEMDTVLVDYHAEKNKDGQGS